MAVIPGLEGLLENEAAIGMKGDHDITSVILEFSWPVVMNYPFRSLASQSRTYQHRSYIQRALSDRVSEVWWFEATNG